MDTPAAVPPTKTIPLWVKILLALVVIVVGLAIVVAIQPAEFKIERTATIAAPPQTVFDHVNDFHKWNAWSPWEKLDPDLKRTYEGAEQGKGAIYRWVGNDQVGEGSMEILESRPAEEIDITLQFIKPFAATSKALFKFEPVGEQTKVTWTMSGDNGFMGKVFSLIMNMDKIVGGQFDEGLQKLKTAAEAEPKS